MENMDDLNEMSMRPNRGGAPSRSINDLSAINTVQDEGLMSANSFANNNKMNAISQYLPDENVMTKMSSAEFEMLDGKPGKSSEDFKKYKQEQYKNN